MSCCYKGCQNPPNFSCSCMYGLLVCRDHISTHLISVGNHQTTSSILSIDNTQRPELATFLKDRIDLNSKLMKYIINISEKTIRLISDLSSKTLSEILQKQKRLRKTLLNIRSGRIVEKDIFDEFNKGDKITNSTPNFDIERLQELLLDEFNIGKIMSKMREDKYAIYFDSNASNKINLLNLDTFEISAQIFQSPNVFSQCGCLKIDESKYFIIDQSQIQNNPDSRNRNQGMSKKKSKNNYETNPSNLQNSQAFNRNIDSYVPLYSYSQKNNNRNFSAKLIDLSNNTSEVFFHDIPSCESGLCLFDEEIFAFGGGKSKSFSLKFNLAQKCIIRVQGLPEFNSNATAARLKNNIIIGGYNSKKLFLYNPRKNIFNDSNFCLLENHQKYIFENFIVCFDDHIYEIHENGTIYKIFQLNYSHQNRSPGNGWYGNVDSSVNLNNSSGGFMKMSRQFENNILLNSSACFKRNNYIHFIVQGPRLYRINIISRLVDLLDLNY